MALDTICDVAQTITSPNLHNAELGRISYYTITPPNVFSYQNETVTPFPKVWANG